MNCPLRSTLPSKCVSFFSMPAGVGVTRYSSFLLARQFAVGAVETRQNLLIVDVRAAHVLGARLVFGHARHDLVDGQFFGQCR